MEDSMRRSLWLADYTWPEVDTLVGDGEADTLLVMLGATEQHGPHLPLATDTLIASALAETVAARLGRTLVAPIVPLGTSDEHLGFAGTLSLSKTTLTGLLADIGRSAVRSGFASLVILSAHGGNYDAIALGVEWLREEMPGLRVIALTDLDAARDVAARTHRTDVPEDVAGLHAGESETSQLLALAADLVRMDHAEPGVVAEAEKLLPQLRASGLRPVTPNGVLGDPRRASAERGRRYLEEIAAALAEYVRMQRDTRDAG